MNVKQYNKIEFIQQNTPTLENTNKQGSQLQMQKVRKREASVKACRACSDEGQRDRQKQLLASASECEMVISEPRSVSPTPYLPPPILSLKPIVQRE